jgi:hypothetical protein
MPTAMKKAVKRDSVESLEPMTGFEIYLAGLPIMEVDGRLCHVDKERGNRVFPLDVIESQRNKGRQHAKNC